MGQACLPGSMAAIVCRHELNREYQERSLEQEDGGHSPPYPLAAAAGSLGGVLLKMLSRPSSTSSSSVAKAVA